MKKYVKKHLPELNYDPSRVRTLTKVIILALGFGTILLAGLVAPNAIQIFRPLLRGGKRKNYERERIKQAVRLLERRRLVEFIEDKGETAIRLTNKGRQHLKDFSMHAMTLPIEIWDRKWRVVMFDIPESQGAARRAFQKKLQLLGCCPLQKSVFVYPYSCRGEIEQLASFWNIEKYIHYLETQDLDYSETRARNFFNLA